MQPIPLLRLAERLRDQPPVVDLFRPQRLHRINQSASKLLRRCQSSVGPRRDRLAASRRQTATTHPILVLGTFIGMALYFALPLSLGRPSPGTCAMGYQIIPDEGERLTLVQALKRAFFGFIAVCSAYAVPFKRREKENGKFWLDIKFGTHAVKLD